MPWPKLQRLVIDLGYDVTAVTARLRARRQHVETACSKPCELRVARWRASDEQLVACRCVGCIDAFMRNHLGYTHTIARSVGVVGTVLTRDEVEQEAFLVLHEALLSWDTGPTFIKVYGWRLRMRFRDLRRRAHRRPEPLSIDEAIVGDQLTDDGRFVAHNERIPDRTTCTETIVILRERAWERIEEVRARIASAGDAFDARRAAGAFA